MRSSTQLERRALRQLAIMGSLGLSIPVYIVVALLLVGDVIAPVLFLSMFSDRLGAPFWKPLVLASAAVSAYAAFMSGRFGLDARYLIPAFVGFWMCLSVVSVGVYVEWARHSKVQEFSPDAYIGRSFFQSIREAPLGFRIFLHAVALKNCKPYAWSYRQMAFYELAPSRAPHVLPLEWLKRCAIERPK
jgi:hypothetical protein